MRRRRLTEGDRPPPFPAEFSEALDGVASTILSDLLDGAALSGPRPLHREQPTLCGSALTVVTRPGDNLAVQRAIDLAQPGDVLIVAGGGLTSQAVLGEVAVRIAIHRGVVGAIVDGAVRDARRLRELKFPVFATGTSPARPSSTGPGGVSVPVTVGDCIIRPGDVVFGDEDGLVSASRTEILDIVAAIPGAIAHDEVRAARADAGSADWSHEDVTISKVP